FQLDFQPEEADGGDSDGDKVQTGDDQRQDAEQTQQGQQSSRAADGESGTDSGEKVYTPGDDGRIHIEKGDVEITAAQPEGPDGPTVVQVDDGSGEPTTC